MPQPSPGLGLVGAVGVTRSVAITAEGLFLPEVRASDGRFGFGLTAIAIGACVDVLHRDEIDLAACGAVWGGALHAVVYALIPDAPGDFAWAAVEIGPRLRVRLAPHVHAELGAHVFAPLVRRPFVVEGHADTVFRQSVIAAEPFLGLGANFR